MSSNLLNLRNAAKAVLTTGDSPLWDADSVIVNRRLKIWNEVATSIQSSKHGAVLVIGIAKGDPDPKRPPKSANVQMDLTIPVTLIELPDVDPDGAEEDELWEQTVVLLNANPLGRIQKPKSAHDLEFAGFDEVEHDQYVIRQTLFKTRLILNPANTPQP